VRIFRSCAFAAFAAFELLASLALVAKAAAAPVVLDSGDDASAWTAVASPGATARIAAGKDKEAGAFGLAFDLGRGRSHAIARRPVSLDLPADYMFVFALKADCEPNTVEIKFISGGNVWWRRLADYEFPRDWKDLRVSKSRIAFAWGPAGGGMPVHLDAIEIAVVAGKGGKGELWIDEIRLEPRDEAAAKVPPTAAVSSNSASATNLLDGEAATAWRSDAVDPEPVITLDFHEDLEQGGLEVAHAAGGFAAAYTVEASRDSKSWEEVRRFTKSDGGVDHVYMPDVYARYVRLRFSPSPGVVVAVGEIRPQPFDFSASPNGFFGAIAKAAAPGLYPRYFRGEQSYWTVVGAAGGQHEALVNEEGSVEIDAGAFTLEPFLVRDGALRTWKDATTSVALEDGDLPIPTVTRRDGELTLAVTAFAAGDAEASTLYVRYRVTSESAARVRLFAALRPFQVLPPWQTLNRTGGVASLRRIERDDRTVRADDSRVIALATPDAFGAAAFEQGDVTSFLLRGEVPPDASVDDPFSHASAALAWDLDLAAGKPRDIWLAVPWPGAKPSHDHRAGTADPDALLAATKAEWRSHLDRVGIELPQVVRDWANSLRSNLAYVLINRDGAAIQPGSRTYERSWIRDGAMTSGALLELGFDDEVKQFLRWFAGYVGKDGWVPCCVDARGADPVPEHDSFGEFIWAVAEVWRFTRDEAFVSEMWPHVKAVAGCMSRLRATRMTPAYKDGDKRAMFGLLPESISHEGYSARPVHSYWDQAFALRGFIDAAMLAGVVGDPASAAALAAERDDFRAALTESIRLTTLAHHLDVVPASVELGDFDPTSTAVAFLLGTEDVYARDALERSFDKYVGDLRARRGLRTPGVGYTAYELRNATALLLLGRKAEAIELLSALTDDQRPAAWNQWPEISWLSPLEPSFLGDLPHTWIGSTYVHAVRTLLVTEREKDDSLLVAGGIPLEWLNTGGDVGGRALPTWFGLLTLRIRRQGESDPERVVVELEAATGPGDTGPEPGRSARASSFVMPAGGIEVAAPFGGDVAAVTVDGVAGRLEQGSVRVRRLPATVVFEYKPRLENPR